jgi:hypothetical protein
MYAIKNSGKMEKAFAKKINKKEQKYRNMNQKNKMKEVFSLRKDKKVEAPLSVKMSWLPDLWDSKNEILVQDGKSSLSWSQWLQEMILSLPNEPNQCLADFL